MTDHPEWRCGGVAHKELLALKAPIGLRADYCLVTALLESLRVLSTTRKQIQASASGYQALLKRLVVPTNNRKTHILTRSVAAHLVHTGVQLVE